MDDLIEEMKVSLASTFSFYLKAHNFHWNVEGPNFSQYHAFFETIYTDAWDAVDAIAEHIRALNSYAPGSLTRFKDLTVINDELNISSSLSMVTKLLEDNQKIITTLTAAYKLAEANNKCGLSNFLQDRIDRHEKNAWMLRSIVKA